MSRQDFFSSRFQYTFGAHPPTLRVEPGASLRVVCPDSDNELADGTLLSRERRQAQSGSPLFPGNPVAGPIHVAGAVEGDALSVRIDGIELDRKTGQTLLAPAHGLLPLHLLVKGGDHLATVPRHMYRWQIDPQAGVAHVTNPLGSDPITVRLDPFVGCIATAPKWGQAISTLFCGDFGGNMDIPCVRPGATVYLPVHCDGGLVMMGDIHGAQGHGEIIGGGIETSGKILCTVNVIKGWRIETPRLRDATHLRTIATDGEVRDAVKRAYGQLLQWLADDLGLNRWDAYHLISQTASFMTGGLSSAPQAVAAAIPIDVLPERARVRLQEQDG